MTVPRPWKPSLVSILALLAALMTTAALALVMSAPAQAHSELTGSSPADGDSLEEAPTEVALEFNEDIQPLGTEVVVTGPDGEQVNDGDVVIDGPTVTQPISADTDGTYTVTWRAVSADGHPISGEYTYDLALPATTEATTEPTSEDGTDDTTEATEESTEASVAPSSSDAEEESSGSDAAVPIIVVIVLLAAAAAVILVVRRRRAR